MKFLKALSLLKRPSFFLEDLCTPVDLMAMAARWRVVKELKKDKPYRQIHAENRS
ncbi:Trp family transcriptional regulator [Francisella noatunensis]